MREILFRGKRTDNGKWIEGYYLCLNSKKHLIYTGYAETDCGNYYPDCYGVIPESISEFTGLTDKNGKKIFEGDIIETGNFFSPINKLVINIGAYTPSAYCKEEYKKYKSIGFYAWDGYNEYQLSNYPERYKVIGNIHDNPELLGGAEQ